MPAKDTVTIDSRSGEVETLPASKRCRAKLDTVSGVRQEMAAVYRQQRIGKLDSSELSRLFYCLNLLRQTIESSDFESRLDALESGIDNEIINS